MDNVNPVGLLFVAAGLFSLGAAALNWQWFMDHRKARFMVRILGRVGARIFYSVLGIGLVILGSLMTLGVIKNTQ